MEFTELQRQRLAKLERLRDGGIDPFPPRTERTHTIQSVLENFDQLTEDQKHITIAGRILGGRRVMGKLSFAHIDDGTAKMQLWISRGDVGDEWFHRFRDDIDTFDIIQASGTLRTTKTGEKSLFVQQMVLLAKSINSPPEKFHGLTDVEARLRERYVDLIVNEEVREVFRTRAHIIRAMQHFLEDQGFMGVETPLLQPIYGGASARPFVTHHNQLHQDLYLRIAPELYLKRLIVGGFEKVYEIGKSFRNEGVDRTHNPEFTIMECYQAYANYHDMMQLVEDMMRAIVQDISGTMTIQYLEHSIDFSNTWQRVSMPEAILEHTGIDILEVAELDTLQEAVRAAHLRVELKPSWAKQVDELYTTFVRPRIIQPTFMIDHPVPLSPLAKRRGDQPFLTERFQPIIAGMEVGNAFTELNDPLDQEQRFLEQKRAFSAGDDEAQQMDLDFINALMYGMPPTGGLGIGVDRVVMLFTNQETIREVVLFPHLRQRDL